MSEEKKDNKKEEKIISDEGDVSKKESDQSEDFSVGNLDDDLFADNSSNSDLNKKEESEDLPEEIKQRLEKNKQARNKKKIIKKKKKKENVKIKSGHAYINATYNNTILSLADKNGNIISWASAGMAGFKGAKKATPYAAQIITKIATLKAKEEYGLESVKVFVSGVGTGREGAIRALNANGIEIESIKDITAVPHNGCRPKKPRRV
ncbi:30S ribosomal protein S11 [Candidatus Falkowbacteria bacterium HGW-Falkowbacteria-1]|uniref:Small ribosomal subunit protein uS11 n=1 Tax=Candidatus Falkowbacteria bacterium HGW-Falkowbacteria-1 TaxID=2013768 RepID=A0A2N2E9M7_9BACT|nr:MAG: 30S ribosomal protein S11 [Candidatus Falkowbacteria bacterium HGW-Falkowbacteria-1]